MPTSARLHGFRFAGFLSLRRGYALRGPLLSARAERRGRKARQREGLFTKPPFPLESHPPRIFFPPRLTLPCALPRSARPAQSRCGGECRGTDCKENWLVDTRKQPHLSFFASLRILWQTCTGFFVADVPQNDRWGGGKRFPDISFRTALRASSGARRRARASVGRALIAIFGG